MFTAEQFLSALKPSHWMAFVRPQGLKARVRKTHGGVRIKYSDGRISWYAKHPQTADDTFRMAVEHWITRHGVDSNGIEWE